MHIAFYQMRSKFIFRICFSNYRPQKRKSTEFSKPEEEKKMSSLKFVKIVLQMIVIKNFVEVNYCNSFNHTAGNRHPFGSGLFIKFTFVCIGIY